MHCNISTHIVHRFNAVEMKKIALLYLLAGTVLSASAQNVGIGTTIPAEKLDVNGNINITGTIKANGLTGTAGQALISTGGGLAWQSIGSAFGYKKCTMITNTGSGSWTVPAGVTEVMAELWGGGSAGNLYFGGTSGGYARTVQPVMPGNSLSYVVGAGGIADNGFNSATDGGQTTVNFSNGAITASGGEKSNLIYPGAVQSGTSSLSNAYLQFGNLGGVTISSFGQKNATTYTETKYYGTGGLPAGFNIPQERPFITYSENGTLIKAYNVPGTVSTKIYSAGSSAHNSIAQNGGQGLIIFWYN